MNPARPLTVGVLGGMGPAATVDFLSRLVAACTGGRDQDHLRTLTDNNPFVPDRNRVTGGEGPSPAPVLAEMARGLARAGAEVLVMPCNAAHAFEADIRAATSLPFISMIAATAEAAHERRGAGTAVGVLAADGCLRAGLYQGALAERGLRAIVSEPDDQARFMALLYRIKGGDIGPAARAEMAALAAALVEAGAEALIAGCTEVPLVLAAETAPAPLISSTDVLVERTLAFARSGAAAPFQRR